VPCTAPDSESIFPMGIRGGAEVRRKHHVLELKAGAGPQLGPSTRAGQGAGPLGLEHNRFTPPPGLSRPSSDHRSRVPGGRKGEAEPEST
jgi:hypothetical protein